MKGIIALAVCVLFLSGCSSKQDAAIVEKEMAAVEQIAQSEGERIASVKAAHSETVQAIVFTPDATAGEKILGLALVGRDFSEAAKSRMAEILANFKRATLGTDAQKTIAHEAGKGLPIVGMTVVSREAIQADRGTTTVSTQEGDVSLNDSLNRTETHATAIDSADADLSSVSSTERDESVTDDHSTQDMGVMP